MFVQAFSFVAGYFSYAISHGLWVYHVMFREFCVVKRAYFSLFRAIAFILQIHRKGCASSVRRHIWVSQFGFAGCML